MILLIYTKWTNMYQFKEEGGDNKYPFQGGGGNNKYELYWG